MAYRIDSQMTSAGRDCGKYSMGIVPAFREGKGKGKGGVDGSKYR